MSPLSVVDTIETDWRRLRRSVLLERRYSCWREREPALCGLAGPVVLLRYLHAPGRASEDKDRVLCALLRQARVDPLAGRVVLQAILPGLKRIAGRTLIDVRELEELWSLLLAAAWARICGYPVERRPRRVAANLLLDTLSDALRELRKTSSAHARFMPAGRTPPPPPESASTHEEHDKDGGDVEALLDSAVAAGALDREQADLILESRIDGVPLWLLAARASVPYNTLKLRRQRAERRLLVFLGYRPVPRGQQNRPSSGARVSGAGHLAPSDGRDQTNT